MVAGGAALLALLGAGTQVAAAAPPPAPAGSTLAASTSAALALATSPATTFVGVADCDRDGKADIVARENGSRLLWLYPGPGTRSYSSYARVQIGNDW